RVVLAAVASKDHNGALMDTAMCLERARRTLPKDTCMVVTEFDRVEDIEEPWSEYENMGVRVDAFVLAGHGTVTSVCCIQQQHIDGGLCNLIRALARPQAPLLLDAC